MTSTQFLKLAGVAIGLLVILTAVSSGGYQQTQSLLVDDNETANASFSAGPVIVIGNEQVYDGPTVCVGNDDCGAEDTSDDDEDDDDNGGPPDMAGPPYRLQPGPRGR